jgi:ribosomal protein L21E
MVVTNDNSRFKRKADENNNSRFKEMAKRFKVGENCDVDIDETLADTVTDSFRNGIEEES